MLYLVIGKVDSVVEVEPAVEGFVPSSFTVGFRVVVLLHSTVGLKVMVLMSAVVEIGVERYVIGFEFETVS